jgi:4-amino-4-deoxy-L-arabinose transferase-like glycosyltransferase
MLVGTRRGGIIKGKEPFIIILVAVLIGLSSAFYLYTIDRYSLLYYGDAVSHLVKARQFVDSTNPGLVENLGTVWLPLPHLLLLPFSLIRPLFETGFAGLAVSLPCVAITSLFLYRMVKMQIGIVYIALIGALVYISNPNIIYTGISAMTEAPFMLFFVASAYYFQKWYQNLPKYRGDIENNTTTTTFSQKRILIKIVEYFRQHQFSDLLICSIFASLATLCRYEGWIIPIFLVIFVIITMLSNRKKYNLKYKASIVVFSLISLSGIVFWLSWNSYYYGDPLEFQNAPFISASSMATEGGYRSDLYLQPLKVASVYSVTALAMYGPVLLIAAIIGYILHRYTGTKEDQRKRNVLYLFLALPPAVLPISLLSGAAELNTRHLWFNSRYLILMSPLVIMLISILLAKLRQKMEKKHFVMAGVIVLLFVYQIATPALGIVTFLDAQYQSSSTWKPSALKMANALRDSYTGGTILIITGSKQHNNIMQESGIPLSNFDPIGSKLSMSKDSFQKPWQYVNYIIISKNADTSAQTVAKYWLERKDQLNKYFSTLDENEYYVLMVHK